MMKFVDPFELSLIFGSSLLPMVHGGGEGAGILGVLDQILSQIERGVGAGWQPFPGLQGMGINLHPVLVHFPIAFLYAFFLCEVIAVVLRHAPLRRLASGMLYFGAGAAVLTVIAGFVAASTVPHGEAVHEIMEWHEQFGLTVTVLAAVLAIWRAVSGPPESAMAKGLSFGLGIVMLACLTIGADLGGLMVYGHGVGVQALQSAQESDRHRHGGATDVRAMPE